MIKTNIWAGPRNYCARQRSVTPVCEGEKKKRERGKRCEPAMKARLCRPPPKEAETLKSNSESEKRKKEKIRSSSMFTQRLDAGGGRADVFCSEAFLTFNSSSSRWTERRSGERMNALFLVHHTNTQPYVLYVDLVRSSQ